VIVSSASRWDGHHPGERALLSSGLLLIALWRVDLGPALVVLAVTTGSALTAGLSPVQWARWMALPLGFVSLSILPFAIASPAAGLSHAWLAHGQWWSPTGAARGAALGARALACASCVVLFAATTPVHRCALLLRRIGVPSMLTDAIVLTIRLQDVVRERFHARVRAARLRLGAHSWSARWRTSASLGAGLLLDTVIRAQRLERGLALRGGFSTERVVAGGWDPLSPRRAAVVAAVVVITALLAFLVAAES
jgi:cobalt/nickel transport system permease protein